MQRETMLLFGDEAKNVLNGILGFKKTTLKPVETVEKTVPVVGALGSSSDTSSRISTSTKHDSAVETSSQDKTPRACQDGSTSPTQPLKRTPKRLKPIQGASETEMHGWLGVGAGWRAPVTVLDSKEIARPGYDDTTSASEYNDCDEVLRSKVKYLAKLIRQSKRMCAYTGAGISTASGIDDYASRGDAHSDFKVRSPYDAQPTKAHHVLAALHRSGSLKHWVQQNHDGLPQKAGYPQADLNEIHGAWYDPSNPVVPMQGQLRTDLFEWLLQWTDKADLLLVLGTSLSGMNADRMVVSAAQRQSAGRALGAVIVSLQRTQHDGRSALRIFGTIDQVLSLLAEEMNLKVGSVRYEPTWPGDFVRPNDKYLVPYDAESGKKLAEGAPRTVLDLAEDALVQITRGQFKGDQGVVVNRNPEGHWRIQFRHEIGRRGAGGKSFKAPMVRVLGHWWVEQAVKGELPFLPIVNAPASRAAAGPAATAGDCNCHRGFKL
eukprot:g3602.t1